MRLPFVAHVEDRGIPGTYEIAFFRAIRLPAVINGDACLATGLIEWSNTLTLISRMITMRIKDVGKLAEAIPCYCDTCRKSVVSAVFKDNWNMSMLSVSRDRLDNFLKWYHEKRT